MIYNINKNHISVCDLSGSEVKTYLELCTKVASGLGFDVNFKFSRAPETMHKELCIITVHCWSRLFCQHDKYDQALVDDCIKRMAKYVIKSDGVFRGLKSNGTETYDSLYSKWLF